jgi:hypothetical protein
VGGVQYAVQPYYNIEIIPFLRSVPSDAFLRVNYPLIFVVPVIPLLAIVRDLLLGGDINTPSNNFKP